LERAIETAGAIAREHALEPQVSFELGEIRIGEWQGYTMAELERREDWRRFNAYRSGTRCPGGEMMIETQARMAAELERLRERHANETVAVVSHGDPLRALLMHYLGMPLDLVHRFDISPASLSIVEASEWQPRVLCLNGTGDELL
jgi:probable phosphoglycerate mutase